MQASLFGTAPSSVADPGQTEVVAPTPAPVPIAWWQLGRPDRIDIQGADQPVDTDIPVPDGVTPGMLTGMLASAVNVAGGRVDVLDGRGLVLGSIPAPADQVSVPFLLDISAAQVTDGVAALTFVARDPNPSADSCTRPPALTLAELGWTYRGEVPYPSTVADFIPGYLEQILIRAGPSPTAAQQQAALELVARLARYYRPIPVRIDVDTAAESPPPSTRLRRIIELRDAGRPGLTVENPGTPEAVLVISGTGPELSRQVALFSDRRAELAQTSSAAVSTAEGTSPVGATVKTFAQLGISGEVSVLGAATLYVGVDIGQFAVGPTERAELHLIANYTPITGGEGSVVIRTGNRVLASHRLDESGKLAITGVVPPEAITSTIGMAVQLRYMPSQRCAPVNDRMVFTVDPSSTVAVTPGRRNRGGFPVLPMAFTPKFDVVLDEPEHLRLAARAIALLAQQTAVPLQPRISTPSDVTGSGLGAVVVGPGETLSRMGFTPPVLPSESDSADINGTPFTDVDFDGPIGVIQAFSQRDRMILAINASHDWSLVDRAFDYIDMKPSRWASLSGDVVATGAVGRTVNLTVREGGTMIDEYPGDGWKWWTWATAGLVTAALVAAAVLLRPRRRDPGS